MKSIQKPCSVRYLVREYMIIGIDRNAALQAIIGPLKNITSRFVNFNELEKEVNDIVKDLLKERIETITGEVNSYVNGTISSLCKVSLVILL